MPWCSGTSGSRARYVASASAAMSGRRRGTARSLTSTSQEPAQESAQNARPSITKSCAICGMLPTSTGPLANQSKIWTKCTLEGVMEINSGSKCPLCGSHMTKHGYSHSDGDSWTEYAPSSQRCASKDCELPVKLWSRIATLNRLLEPPSQGASRHAQGQQET